MLPSYKDKNILHNNTKSIIIVSYAEFREKSKPLRILLDMRVAASMDKKLQETLPKNLSLVEEIIKKNKLKQEPWSKSILKSISYSERYHFFHWELEFPDAYTDERKGFDLVVMNPPWSAVRLYDDDFFEEYDSKFRRVSTKQDKNKLKAELMNKKLIAACFNDYMESIQQKLFFFKESGEYAQRAAGGMAFDYWALFLERALTILSTEGTLSVLLPFGIVGNEGATHLRKSLLKNHIRYFYEFENANGIFPDIHRQYKFVLLVVDNGASEKEFNAAFYLHDVAALDSKIESTKFVRISKEFIDLASPLSYSIPEIRRQEELTICTKLYKKHPLLFQGIGNYWKFTIMRELNRTESADLFRADGKGWSVIEGKNFHQFVPNYEKPTFTILEEKGLKQTSKVKEYGTLNKEIHDVPRLVFRTVASSTNVRTMIACIVPKNTFIPNSASIILPRANGILELDNNYFMILSYLAAIFNSMIFDFLIRLRVTMNLNFFYVYQTPIPSRWDSHIAKEIIKLSARLSSTEKNYGDFSRALKVELGHISMRDRIEMTAKLDALVARHYGLTKEEYSYVISSFSGFEDDKNLEKSTQYDWSDTLIKKLNGEVRKRALKYFENITPEEG